MYDNYFKNYNLIGDCPVCGTKMKIEEWFKEKEYDKLGIPTGRTRLAASNLICPNCLHREVIDDTFDGNWH